MSNPRDIKKPSTQISNSLDKANNHEENKSVSFLEEKNIPQAVANDHIGPCLTLKEMADARCVNKSSAKTLFRQGPNSFEQRIAQELLKNVLYGNQARVVQILQLGGTTARAALFIEAQTNDHIERIGVIRSIKQSPYMAMWGAQDPHMLHAVEPFLVKIPNGRQLARQCAEQFMESSTKEISLFDYTKLVAAISADPCSDGGLLPATEKELAEFSNHYKQNGIVITHGKHFDAKIIYFDALQVYNKNFSQWNFDQQKLYSKKILGLLQSLFSAHSARAIQIGLQALLGMSENLNYDAQPFTRLDILFHDPNNVASFLGSNFLFSMNGERVINIDFPEIVAAFMAFSHFYKLIDTHQKSMKLRLQHSSSSLSKAPLIEYERELKQMPEPSFAHISYSVTTIELYNSLLEISLLQIEFLNSVLEFLIASLKKYVTPGKRDEAIEGICSVINMIVTHLKLEPLEEKNTLKAAIVRCTEIGRKECLSSIPLDDEFLLNLEKALNLAKEVLQFFMVEKEHKEDKARKINLVTYVESFKLSEQKAQSKTCVETAAVGQTTTEKMKPLFSSQELIEIAKYIRNSYTLNKIESINFLNGITSISNLVKKLPRPTNWLSCEIVVENGRYYLEICSVYKTNQHSYKSGPTVKCEILSDQIQRILKYIEKEKQQANSIQIINNHSALFGKFTSDAYNIAKAAFEMPSSQIKARVKK